jgi:carbon-monoxide dehydrogenase medium subunit
MMKPAPFTYFAPESIDTALALMQEHGNDARLLAGGQSLVASLNFRCLTPTVLVDLNVLPGLDGIWVDSKADLHIGAMVRYRQIERDPLIAQHAPLVQSAIPYIAHTAIRTRGTIGGSLAYADPAAELPAVTLALEARYRVRSAAGERWIEARDFFQDSFLTALAPEEILVEVVLPAQPSRTGWGFHELARRQGDRVMMGVAAAVSLDESGTCRKAVLTYMNAARKTTSAPHAAAQLIGISPTTADLKSVAHQAAVTELDPPDDVHATAAFRRHLAEELTFRALTDAFERAGEEK